MADFIMLRKGRNVLSSIVHVGLNIALAVVSTALTVISGNCVFAILLVILSKWRVIAVRPLAGGVISDYAITEKMLKYL